MSSDSELDVLDVATAVALAFKHKHELKMKHARAKRHYEAHKAEILAKKKARDDAKRAALAAAGTPRRKYVRRPKDTPKE